MDNYKSKFQSIEYNAEKKLVIQKWTSESKNLNEERFKEEMFKLKEFFENKQPEKVFIDHRDFKYPVVPALQEWINNNVNTKLAELKTKTAFLVSSDLFTSVSVQQTLDEASGKEMTKKFFEDENKAKKWLEI